jgi:two-component system sensor histidine kinase YesM
VENAIEHGMKDTISKGLVKVSFERSQNMGSEDMFCICVEDNGESLTDDMLIQLQKSLENVSEENEITGLINVHRRISLKYGGQSGISAERSFLGGLKVVINIQEALDNPNLKEGTDLYV